MIEWDLDSYIRKYRQTLTVFKNKKGEKTAKFVKDISQDEDNHIVFHFINDKTKELEPEYFRFQSKIYPTKNNGFVSIKRNIRKCYQIGLSAEGFSIYPLKGKSPHLHEIEIFTPIEINIEEALRKEGPINKQFYLTKNNVLFLDQEVGLRKGSKFLVKEAVCQELQDILLGFECSIST